MAGSSILGVLLTIFPSVSLLFAQSILPPEFLTGDSPVGAAAGDQTLPDIALGGNQYLAVWTDTRAAIGGETGAGFDIYAMRIDTSGNPIDPLPILVTQAPADQTNPKVVWNGQNWLVVWMSNAANGIYYSTQLQAARVSPAGVVLDPKPIVVHPQSPTSAGMWTAGTDGTNWAVFWEGTSAGENNIVGARISPAGQVLDNPPVLALQGSYYLMFNLDVAFSQGTYLLAWQDLNDLRGLRLNAGLQPIDPGPITLAGNNQSTPHLAGGGSGFFFVWSQQQPDFTMAVVGSRIDLSGALLEPSGINISQARQPEPYGAIDLVWNGSVWMATWSYAGNIAVARTTPAGALLDPGGRIVPGVKSGPVAPSAAGGLQVVWSEAIGVQYQSYDVKSAAISPLFAGGPVKIISSGAPSHSFSDAASSGNGWMLVFRSTTSDQQRVMAQPLDRNGGPVTPEPVVLDTGIHILGPDAPAVAWNGTYFLVVWANASKGGILGLRLLPDGALVDSAPFLILPGWSPDVAALGDNFLVVSLNAPSNPEFVWTFGARVRGSDGAVLDPSPVSIGQSFTRYHAVTTLGSRWLVAWQQHPTHDDPRATIVAGFVGANGAPGAPFSVAGLIASLYRGPAVASSGNNALIVYEDERISSVETEIVARRVLPDGTLLDGSQGISLTSVRGNQFRKSVAWNGREYVVAWQDQRNRISELDILDSKTAVFFARVSETGALIDPAGNAFAAAAGASLWPAAAGNTNGETLLAASVMQAEAPHAGYRIGYGVYPAGNQWPVAVATANPSSGVVPLAVSFSSAGSFDPDGAIVSYAWDFGDGTTSTGPDAAHTYAEPGDYVATLAILDDAGAKSANTMFVRANHVNQPPVAVASAVPTSGPAPLNVTFYATGSFDPDGQIITIAWTFSDGGSYFGSPAYHTFNAPGIYTVTLTVTDNEGATGSTSLVVEVGAFNAPPVAVASANPTLGVVPLAVQFSSAGSYDPDGAIVSYLWNFDDGTTSTLPNPSHTYTAVGAYWVTLTVADDRGTTASSNVSVMVTDLPALRSIGITITGRVRQGTALVRGVVTVTDQSNLAIGGAVVTARWTLPDGTTATQNLLTTRAGKATFNTQGPPGTYRLSVRNITKPGYVFDAAHSVLAQTALIQ